MCNTVADLVSKVLLGKPADTISEIESDKEDEEELDIEDNYIPPPKEVSLVWGFKMPNNRFYVIIRKTSGASYRVDLLNDFEIQVTMTYSVTDNELKLVAEALHVPQEYLQSNFSDQKLSTIIVSEDTLINAPTTEKKADELTVISFPIKANTISIDI